MKRYHNIMEDLVEEFYDSLKGKSSCCACEQCRADVIALALNQFPARYVTTGTGASLSKMNSLRMQYKTDLHVALTRAMQIVAEHPRHEAQP